MKYLLLVIASFIGIQSMAGDEKGNGQLVVKHPNGQVIPFEEALTIDTEEFMGIDELPEFDDPNYPVAHSLKREFYEWHKLIASYSPRLAENFKAEAIKSDFVFLNKNLHFKIEDYKNGDFPVDYKDSFKAAGYYKGKIYISIPAIDSITASDRFTKSQLQGFVLIHELLHPMLGKRSLSDKIYIGKLILNAKATNMKKNRFHLLLNKYLSSYLSEMNFEELYTLHQYALSKRRNFNANIRLWGNYEVKIDSIDEIKNLTEKIHSASNLLSIVSTAEELIKLLTNSLLITKRFPELNLIAEIRSKFTYSDFSYFHKVNTLKSKFISRYMNISNLKYEYINDERLLYVAKLSKPDEYGTFPYLSSFDPYHLRLLEWNNSSGLTQADQLTYRLMDGYWNKKYSALNYPVLTVLGDLIIEYSQKVASDIPLICTLEVYKKLGTIHPYVFGYKRDKTNQLTFYNKDILIKDESYRIDKNNDDNLHALVTAQNRHLEIGSYLRKIAKVRACTKAAKNFSSSISDILFEINKQKRTYKKLKALNNLITKIYAFPDLKISPRILDRLDGAQELKAKLCLENKRSKYCKK